MTAISNESETDVSSVAALASARARTLILESAELRKALKRQRPNSSHESSTLGVLKASEEFLKYLPSPRSI